MQVIKRAGNSGCAEMDRVVYSVDSEALMEEIAQKLTDDDIHNAAAYLSQASDSTAGDGMEIENATVLTNVKIVK